MIDTVQYSTVICDNCGRRFSWLDAPSPQQVTRHLVNRYGWTAFDDIHHCAACPPICSSCGLDDIDCECTPRRGDTGYVSREPSVIRKLDTCDCCPLDDEAADDGQG